MKHRQKLIYGALNVDSWLKSCIKRTYTFFREYSYSYASKILKEGQILYLYTEHDIPVGKIEVINIDPGLEVLSEENLEQILLAFNNKDNLTRKKDLDGLIYDFGINDFSCRLICKLYFFNKTFNDYNYKAEFVLPINPNILDPSTIYIYKKFNTLKCILVNSIENPSSLSDIHLEFLKSFNQNLSFILKGS